MTQPQWRVPTNLGTEIMVPTRYEDDYPYFLPDSEGISSYYHQFGYVVIRGLVPHALLAAANKAFDREVLPSRRFIYRQTTANPEQHTINNSGFMENPILNPHSVDPRHFKSFRAASEAIYTDINIQRSLQLLFAEPGKQVQGMYFHGNPATWPHQDTYYLDSEKIGAMTAVWIACEDITPGAGRFFVCPGSHKIDLENNRAAINYPFNHDRYKQLIKDTIIDQGLELCAPALAMGDVLFWNSKTIHGSLPTSQPGLSRRSFTAHYIPESHNFLMLQSQIKSLVYEKVNNMRIYRPKDQAEKVNRAVLFVETRFPRAFQAVKKAMIAHVTTS
jgi:phytanoyl-CoA hydroxylase